MDRGQTEREARLEERVGNEWSSAGGWRRRGWGGNSGKRQLALSR